MFGLALQVLIAWLGGILVAPRLAPAARRAAVRRAARRTLGALDVDLRLCGAPPVAGGAVLAVANHVSWLDIYALNAVEGSRFVAKTEVRTWPLIGSLAARFGTFFHVRGSYRDAARVKDAIAAALRAGDRVVVFPEGTTTNGRQLRRFYAALLQAAVDAGAIVQPVAIRYRDREGRVSSSAPFVGDMSFATSLARVVGAPITRVELTFGPAIAARHHTRREIATLAERFVANTLGLPLPSERRGGRRHAA